MGRGSPGYLWPGRWVRSERRHQAPQAFCWRCAAWVTGEQGGLGRRDPGCHCHTPEPTSAAIAYCSNMTCQQWWGCCALAEGHASRAVHTRVSLCTRHAVHIRVSKCACMVVPAARSQQPVQRAPLTPATHNLVVASATKKSQIIIVS